MIISATGELQASLAYRFDLKHHSSHRPVVLNWIGCSVVQNAPVACLFRNNPALLALLARILRPQVRASAGGSAHRAACL